MSIILVKVISLFALFILTLGTGVLPYFVDGRIKRRTTSRVTGFALGNRRARILTYCNCFAGGVFLATCLLDLLPMVEEKYEAAFKQKQMKTVFPIAEFTTCVGLFLILFVEQTVHFFQDRSGRRIPFFHSHEDREAYQPLLDDSVHDIDSISTAGSRNVHEQNSFHDPAKKSPDSAISSQQVKPNTEESSTFRAYILIIALSLHSLFEGLALGLIEEVKRLAQVTVAVLIHKTLIAFALGVSMVQHNMSLSSITTSCLLFSIMGPVGIGIGIAVIQTTSEFQASISSAVLQGLANGSFLFVTFFEIFHKELSHSRGNRMLKILFMIVGFAIVTGLLYYANTVEDAPHAIKPPVSANGTIHHDCFVR